MVRRKRLTIRDVAKVAGVSTATVSYVINNTRPVTRELRRRVQRTIAELGYQPNRIGRTLRQGRSGTIALLVPDIRDPYFPELIKGVEDCCSRHHYALFLCNTDESPETERERLSLFRSRVVDGVILVPAVGSRNAETEAYRLGVSLVIADRRSPKTPWGQVFSDNTGGAFKATEFLLRQGHRRIAVVAPSRRIPTVEDRIEGYRQALQAHGIVVARDLIAEELRGIRGGYEATAMLMRRAGDISAILSLNDTLGLGVLLYLHEHGIRCPADLSLISFDDPPWARVFDPALTVVVQQTYRMGKEAVNLLMRQMDDPTALGRGYRVKLEMSLRVRHSTATAHPQEGNSYERGTRLGDTKQHRIHAAEHVPHPLL